MRTRVLAACLLGAALLPAAPAHAQLGKMIRRGAAGVLQGAAEDRAREKLGVPEPARGGTNTLWLELTPERLDQFLAAMRPALDASRSRAASGTRGGALPTPQVPDGWTRDQFGWMRERIGAWLVTDGGGPCSEPEKRLLASRRNDLAPYAGLFRGNEIRWTTWSDVP